MRSRRPPGNTNGAPWAPRRSRLLLLLVRGVRRRTALLQQATPLALATQHVAVEHLELHAAVLGHVLRAGVGRDRLRLAVAPGRELVGLELGELVDQVGAHRGRTRVAQLLVVRAAAARVGVTA